MDSARRRVILLRLMEELASRGSWCGETHLQKAMYLLQSMLRVETHFSFVLYKHGPFSFELRDELSAMRGDGLCDFRMRAPNYGPSVISLDPQAGAPKASLPQNPGSHERAISFVAEKLGQRGVAELERLATAQYARAGFSGKPDVDAVAAHVTRLKPHVPPEQAREAVTLILDWEVEARTLGPTSNAPGGANNVDAEPLANSPHDARAAGQL